MYTISIIMTKLDKIVQIIFTLMTTKIIYIHKYSFEISFFFLK